MNGTVLRSIAVVSVLLSTTLPSPAEPYGANGFQGRIALSHDGNFNDEDDWGAFPVTIAILDAFGVKDRLVHIEYNNIIQANDDRFEREMTASVLGAAEKIRHTPGHPAQLPHGPRRRDREHQERGQCLFPRESPLLRGGRPHGRALSRHSRRRSAPSGSTSTASRTVRGTTATENAGSRAAPRGI